MKKTVLKFMLILLSAMGGIKMASADERKPDFVLRTASSMEKLFKNSFKDEWLKPGTDDEIAIFVARGESESFQIAAIPFRDLKNLQWEIESEIPVNNIRVQPVGYVEIVKNTQRMVRYPQEEIKDGWWPDPLFSTWNKIEQVQADQIQPVWVTITVPEDFKPGNYRILLTFFADGTAKAGVTANLTVWDFALPQKTNLKTSFWYSYRDFANYYPEKKDDLWPTIKKFLKLSLDNRMTPVNIDERWPGRYWTRIDFDPETEKYNIDFTDVKKHLKFILEENAKKGNLIHVLEHHFPRGIGATVNVNGQKTVHSLKPFTGKMKNFLTQYLSAWKTFLKENGWSDYAIIYYTDEPGPDVWEAVKWLYPIVKKVVPEWKITTSIGLHLNSAYKEGIYNELDIIVPHFNYALLPDLNYYRSIQKVKELWGYVCSDNSNIDFQPVDIRIWPWVCWKYELRGLLYWGLFVWNYEKPPDYLTIKGMITDKPEERWPYKSQWQPGIFKRGASGDGYLIYPSPEGEPWSSIRLENLRDGIEDYEYFCILKENIEKLKKRGRQYSKIVKEAENLLKIGEDIINNPSDYTRNSENIIKRRKEIGYMIEKTSKLLPLRQRGTR